MVNSSHELVQQAVELLSSPQRPWQSVTGTVSSWFDEDLLHIGRGRYWRTKHPGVEDPSDENPPDLGTLELFSRFWATASPCQLRLERLPRVVSLDRDEAYMPDILIADRWTWWTRTGNQVDLGRWAPDRVVVDRNGKRWGYYGETVVPDPGPHYRTPGIENLDVLLKPAPMPRGFTFPSAQWTNEGGRTAIQLEAVPRRDEEFHLSVAELVALGSDGYLITVDAVTGIVLDVRIIIEGQVARQHRIGDLHVDVPIDDSTFTQPDSVGGSP